MATGTNYKQSHSFMENTVISIFVLFFFYFFPYLFIVVLLLVIYKTGAKPVFPSKSDKDKPKFAVKGHKETTGYPFNKHTFYNVAMVSSHIQCCLFSSDIPN